MATGGFFHLILQATGFLWILLNLVMAIAAFLLFRADSRAHTLCLLLGYVILLFGGIANRFLPMLFRPTDPAEHDHIQHVALIQGVSLIGGALVAYGLFSVALIAYRKSRLPHFEN